MEKAIIVNDLRNVTVNTFSDTTPSDESPDTTAHSSSNRGVASEAARQRRKTFIMVLSFLPFLGASAALGIFVLGSKGNDTKSLDGDVGTITDAIEKADTFISATLAPSTSNSTSIPEIMPVTTSQSPSPSVTEQQGGTPRTSSPTPMPVTTSQPSPMASVAEQQGGKSHTTPPTPASSSSHFPTHGNLRSTTLPTLGKSTTSPTLRTTTLAPSSSANTTRPTPITLLVDAGNGGAPSTAFPLGECQGDCDGDDDCQGSLICFLRDTTESVPGCSGEGSVGADYCYNPRGFQLPLLTDTDGFTLPLSECQGDCDGDDDCEGSLLCFQRGATESVPGCSGEGSLGTDYCFDRRINYLYSPLSTFPLGLCEGDCDSDNECEGSLLCFQRANDESVPGCPGEGSIGTDYCFDRPINYLYSPLNKSPLGLCEGDCDTDDECEGDLICEERSDFTEISGCVGTGVKDSDYCRAISASPSLAPISSSPTVAPTSSSPTTVPSATCVKSGDKCPDDETRCCSGSCEKDKETGEKVCGLIPVEGEEAPSPPNSPQSPDKCLSSGEACTDKKLCCSGLCSKEEGKDKGKEEGKDVRKEDDKEGAKEVCG